jgi:hypothetical protein
MFVIYVVIPFFGYLWFIRRNESIVDKRLGWNYLEMIPHKKNGMWRWQEYWWIEVPCMIFGSIFLSFFLSLSFIFFIT